MGSEYYVSLGKCCENQRLVHTRKTLSEYSEEHTQRCENCGSTSVSTLSWSIVNKRPEYIYDGPVFVSGDTETD